MDRENPSIAHSATPGQRVWSTNEHPLGPYWTIVPLEHRLWSRLYAAGLAAATVSLLVVAVLLHPDEHQLGTHQQLRIPPCGFVTLTGLPCPTCGMTTAFAHTVRGHFIRAMHAQFAGFLLALGVMAVALLSVVSILTGRRPSMNWYRTRPETLIWWTLALLVAAWAFKIVVGMCDGTLPARYFIPHG